MGNGKRKAALIGSGFGGAIMACRLAHADTEGADVGWLTMGTLITFLGGLIAALVFG